MNASGKMTKRGALIAAAIYFAVAVLCVLCAYLQHARFLQ